MSIPGVGSKSKSIYIFLDVDGVLNSRRTLIAFGDYKPESLDPTAIGLLQTLYNSLASKGLDPRIVISSTWRKTHKEIDWWTEILNLPVDGLTPSSDNGIRGEEIEAYLDANDALYAKWVGLDDDNLGKAYNEHWVHVNSDVGLDISDVDSAHYLLTGDNLLPAGYEFAGKWAGMRLWNRRRR